MPSVYNHQDKENTTPGRNRTRFRRAVPAEEQNLNNNSPRVGGARVAQGQVMEQDPRDNNNNNTSPLHVIDLPASSRDWLGNEREPQSPPFRESPTAAMRLRALVSEQRVSSQNDSLDQEHVDVTLDGLSGLESNIQAPFMFPSFIYTPSFRIGPDSIFARLKPYDASARTSSFLAERYRRCLEPLPPIATLLGRQALGSTESVSHRQTGRVHRPGCSGLGEYIAEAARVASELVAAYNSGSSDEEESLDVGHVGQAVFALGESPSAQGATVQDDLNTSDDSSARCRMRHY